MGSMNMFGNSVTTRVHPARTCICWAIDFGTLCARLINGLVHPMDKRPIMLVEDNPSDALLIERALAKSGLHNPVFRAKDGLDAIYYLFGSGRYEDRAEEDLPAVVLIDLNLP